MYDKQIWWAIKVIIKLLIDKNIFTREEYDNEIRRLKQEDWNNRFSS